METYERFSLVCGAVCTLKQNQMDRGRKRRTRDKAKAISSHSNTPRPMRLKPAESHSKWYEALPRLHGNKDNINIQLNLNINSESGEKI